MPAILAKVIKPKKLKEDAMRLALLTGLHEVASGVRKDFEKTTATWEHDVKFETLISLKGGPAIIIGTDDEIYGYVNSGTRPHRIYARPGKRLAFKWGGPGSYKAKTSPGVIGSTAGGATGNMTFRSYVNHPGTKARNFESIIQRSWEKRFKKRMEEAMKQAAKVSGHKK